MCNLITVNGQTWVAKNESIKSFWLVQKIYSSFKKKMILLHQVVRTKTKDATYRYVPTFFFAKQSIEKVVALYGNGKQAGKFKQPPSNITEYVVVVSWWIATSRRVCIPSEFINVHKKEEKHVLCQSKIIISV